MKENILSAADYNFRADFSANQENKKIAAWSRVMTSAMLGGVCAGLTGLFFAALNFFAPLPNRHFTNQFSVWLLIAAFPLLMLGAHAMDKLAAFKKDDEYKNFAAQEKRRNYQPEMWRN